MKEFMQALFLMIVAFALIIAAIYYLWGPVPPIPDPTIQELQAEIDRLAPYEAFIDSQNTTVVYDGCEDIRKRLGLTP